VSSPLIKEGVDNVSLRSNIDNRI